jgi:uncharacterized membrane protein YhaH (DUF805 family)
MQSGNIPEGQILTTPENNPTYVVQQAVFRPMQMMSFVDSMKTVLSLKFIEFNGRASRSEYWWFFLFTFTCGIILSIVDVAFLIIADISFDSILWTITPLTTLFQLIILIPSLAVTVRRFHDIGRSGWWIFIVLVPCVGFILYLVWLIQDGEPHDNMYGAVPTNIL